MTVCVAALCRFPYGKNDTGSAAIMASDRMMTAENFEYEPPMRKLGELTKNAVVLVSGDVTVHSEALQEAVRRLKPIREAAERSDESDKISVQATAECYAACLRDVVARRAAIERLGPYGMTLSGFLERQHLLPDTVVARLQHDLASYQIDVEALVVGHDEIGAHIYVVDYRGQIYCQNDIGFAAIGIGYQQAKSQFMLAGYANYWAYFNVLTLTHWAKRSAEIIAGVGSHTDMHIIGRLGLSQYDDRLVAEMDKQYESYISKRKVILQKAVEKNWKAFQRINQGSSQQQSSVSTEPPPLTEEGCQEAGVSPDKTRDGTGIPELRIVDA